MVYRTDCGCTMLDEVTFVYYGEEEWFDMDFVEVYGVHCRLMSRDVF